MVRHLLTKMSLGGLFDVVGGGFHRYSTDDRWLVPHVEKMLYDNAQLAPVYLHADLLTADESFRSVCEETLSFIQREMMNPQGGFFSSLDADSEVEEGKFYTWSLEQILTTLQDPAETDLLQMTYHPPKSGNFNGAIILQKMDQDHVLAERAVLTSAELRTALRRVHKKLLAARSKRIHPSTDDKVIVSRNALALRAFSESAFCLSNSEYLKIARQNATFPLDHLYKEKQFYRSWRAGQAHHPAYLEDYAGLSIALILLYQVDQDVHWFQTAQEMTGQMLLKFSDPDGGFFDTPQDNVTPSGSALAAHTLLLFSAYDYNPEQRQTAEKMLKSTVMKLAARYPRAFSYQRSRF